MSLSAKSVSCVFAVGLFAAIVAGCGGGAVVGTSAMRPQPQNFMPTTQSDKAAQGNVSFAILIKPKSKARITPQYISPSTQSLQILTDGAHPLVIDLTSSSPNCAPNPSVPGSFICTASLTVPAGNHIFTLTAYDLTRARGVALSTNSTGTISVKTIGTTRVSIVLEGVVHYVILMLATPNPPLHTAAAIGLTPILQDADHNLIIGTAPYEYPVTLTTSDSVNGHLSKAKLTSPADTTGITVNYTGAGVTSITYSAAATGLPAANVINAVLTPGNPTITEYGGMSANARPVGIVAGPDGALWFTEITTGKIGRITTGGSITEYPTPPNPYPDFITAGPDGALWFTEAEGNKIGRLTTGGSLTEYLIPTRSLGAITAGPDGALWFTEPDAKTKIGRITTGGTITEYPIPNNDYPVAIAAGPDGALWFTAIENKIGRITTGGSITEYPIPDGDFPHAIAAGPDGALWFAEGPEPYREPGKIGRITTGGSITQYPIPSGDGAADIAAGPDGALWFTAPDNRIGRITTGGIFTEYPVPTANSVPLNITAGPDGALWFTEVIGSKIGRVTLH